MRLSEAMALGRIVAKLNKNDCTLYEGSGCAMGVALVAAGFPHNAGCRYDVKQYFPWVNDARYEEITALYQSVVKGEMTFDQLIDWVRFVEPQPAPETLSAEGEPKEEVASERQ
jgi:hypothetical protein